MRKAFIFLCTGLCCFATGRGLLLEERVIPKPGTSERIVSLAPSVTETLYALGCGARLVGVTTFCAWPEEVKNKTKVADFSQVNLEALVRARPDLAVIPADKPGACSLVEKLGIPALTLSTRSVDAYVQTVKELGHALGADAEAATVEAAFQRELEAARARACGRKRPRVMFSVMRSEQGLGYIAEINIVGRSGFYSDLLEAAGGENVYRGALAFPKLSREAVIFLNPDIIVDIIRPGDDPRSVRRDWLSLRNVRAIREDRIVLLSGVEDTVPGPRSVMTLSRLSQAFYPDAERKDGEEGR